VIGRIARERTVGAIALSMLCVSACTRPRLAGATDAQVIAWLDRDDVSSIRAALGETFITRILSAEERADVLTVAAYHGAPRVVAALLAAGADVNGRADPDHRVENAWGHTPLYVAARAGHMEIVRALYLHGADATRRDKAGFAPLHVAAAVGRTDVVRFLVEDAQIPVDLPSARGDTALNLAVARAKEETVRYLLTRHADVDAPDVRGDTALHAAVRNNDRQITTLLAASGGHANARNRDGRTPMDDARGRAPDLIAIMR
jgi:ankyrin repeat protein